MGIKLVGVLGTDPHLLHPAIVNLAIALLAHPVSNVIRSTHLLLNSWH